MNNPWVKAVIGPCTCRVWSIKKFNVAWFTDGLFILLTVSQLSPLMTCEWAILFFVSDKRVFVVPTFESKQKLSPLLTKQELLDLWDSGSVQPFYYQACWKCQQNLDFDAWKRYFYSCVYLTLCLKFSAIFPSSTKAAALTVISHPGLFICHPFFCQYAAILMSFYCISECSKIWLTLAGHEELSWGIWANQKLRNILNEY